MGWFSAAATDFEWHIFWALGKRYGLRLGKEMGGIACSRRPCVAARPTTQALLCFLLLFRVIEGSAFLLKGACMCNSAATVSPLPRFGTVRGRSFQRTLRAETKAWALVSSLDARRLLRSQSHLSCLSRAWVWDLSCLFIESALPSHPQLASSVPCHNSPPFPISQSPLLILSADRFP